MGSTPATTQQLSAIDVQIVDQHFHLYAPPDWDVMGSDGKTQLAIVGKEITGAGFAPNLTITIAPEAFEERLATPQSPSMALSTWVGDGAHGLAAVNLLTDASGPISVTQLQAWWSAPTRTGSAMVRLTASAATADWPALHALFDAVVQSSGFLPKETT